MDYTKTFKLFTYVTRPKKCGKVIERMRSPAFSHANLLEQRKCLHEKRVELPQVWSGSQTAVSLFWKTNMAAMTPCAYATLEIKQLKKRSALMLVSV